MSGAPTCADRLVVAFDPYSPAAAALQLALLLTQERPQSLHALYVEDTDALRLGAFPWAREILLATAEARPVLPESLEQDYRSRAAAARALFDSTVSGAVGARFERVRGRLADELRRFAMDAATVFMDWPPARLRGSSWATTVVRTLLDLPAPLVGLVDAQRSAGQALLVVQDSGQPGPAQELAERLAAPEHARVELLTGRVTAAMVAARAREERAGTVLVELATITDGERLVGDLAARWPGSLLVVR
jgi:hypothetical protein